MLTSRKIPISVLACAAAALTLCVAPAPAAAKKKKKTTVIGKVTQSNAVDTTDINGNPVRRGSLLLPAQLTTKVVKEPKPGSITVKVTAERENPADPNSIYVSGLVTCKKKPKEPVSKYVIGGDYTDVPSPFTTKAPFPYGVSKPLACQVQVSSNMDPPLVTGFEPMPPATITITVLWRH